MTFPAPIVSRSRSLAISLNDRRQYPGLWARVSTNEALALVNTNGTWTTVATVTPELRASATRIIVGGYAEEVSADELAEMVVSEIITSAQYEAITGEAYGGVDPEAPVEPEPDVPAEEFPDPDDPGGSGGGDAGGPEQFPDELPMTLA